MSMIDVEVIIDKETGRTIRRKGRCVCGRPIELDDPMTNACFNCGRLYNSSGQELCDPALWEEPIEED